MNDHRSAWKQAVLEAIEELGSEKGIEIDTADLPISAESPPEVKLGDLAFPMFPLAKILREAPASIAAAVSERVAKKGLAGSVEAAGPYVNVRLSRPDVAAAAIRRALAAADRYGSNESHAGQRVTIEFSSPNTNKPLHMGHLRNDALGESVARTLAACGAQVRKVNLINDRGIHICKSMLAYQKFGEGRTPESEGKKGDHFVGEYYVAYNNWVKESPEVDAEARKMLIAWEAGDSEVVALWKRMNEWAISGIKETYLATGVEFDKFYHESDTYASGKAEVLKGLESGAFFRDAEGTVWVDLAPIKLDKKVLLRKDGTSLYLTQDIGTVIARHEDAPFDRMIYVVGSEQNYHFQVLFYVVEHLGFPWASNLHHLSYGMVNLPEGRMKSREGTIVDADELLKELRTLATEQIRQKEREEAVGNIAETAHSIALGALHYYLLQVTATKDMIFNPKESLAFTGNTGPYLQYTCARISSMLRKAGERGIAVGAGTEPPDDTNWATLAVDEEWLLVRAISDFTTTVQQAATELNPSLLASFLYDTARTYSSYYHDHPILAAEDPAVQMARLQLSAAVLVVLKAGLHLLNIPFLDVM
jgi:arginyl-tRNA synthetase